LNTLEAFAQTCDQLRTTTKRSEKIQCVAGYLATLEADELDAAARFFQGSILPPREPQISIGHRTVMAAAMRIFHLESSDIRTALRESGELGEAVAACYAPALDLGFFHESLTPARLRNRMREAAHLRGAQATLKRTRIVEKILADCGSAREVAVVCKIITGELRIGLREGFILDAIAQAFHQDIDEIRRAAAADADVGALAQAAKAGTLQSIEPGYGLPIAAMLASPILFGSTYTELSDGNWIAEDKFDGIRAQLHCNGNTVHLFSRTGKKIEAHFPEIATDAITYFSQPVILDGEILASRNGRALSFQTLQPRIARKDPDAALQHEIPVVFVAFDVLAEGREMLLEHPWHERRAALEKLFVEPFAQHIRIAPVTMLQEPFAQQIHALFDEARARGNEGLMLKRTDSLYSTGRRGKSWLKLKRELATLDVVVTAVEWGHGKRADMLSDYTFAVRGNNDELLTIGKAYSGLTDAEIRTLTVWFQEHMSGNMATRRAHAVDASPLICPVLLGSFFVNR